MRDRWDILVVGSGAREHTIAAQCAMSPLVDAVYAWPGNGGVWEVARPVPVQDTAGLLDFVEASERLLTIIGPEQPLAEGLADRIRARRRMVVGPGQAGARIESSKGWAKALMDSAGVPTARAERVTSPEALEAILARTDTWPMVVKQDGLAQGKGVVVLQSVDEARKVLAAWRHDANIWQSGVLWEQFLAGRECSVIVLCDGEHFAWLPPARDYKQLSSAPGAPNTGGMGAYAPLPWLDASQLAAIQERILAPTLHALKLRDIDYRGFLYAGLMLTDSGPMVLEWNARLGDPETEVILPLLAEDLVPWMEGAAAGRLPGERLAVRGEAAVTVVVSAPGYPQNAETGLPFSAPPRLPGVRWFHGGSRQDDRGGFFNTGGRVLTATVVAPTFRSAQSAALAAARSIDLPGKQIREDIAAEVVE